MRQKTLTVRGTLTSLTFGSASELRVRFITKSYLYNFDPLKPLFYIVKAGFTGAYITYFSYLCSKNIFCGYWLEPPRRGGSNEYPQFTFWGRNHSELMSKYNLCVTATLQKYLSELQFYGDVDYKTKEIVGNTVFLYYLKWLSLAKRMRMEFLRVKLIQSPSLPPPFPQHTHLQFSDWPFQYGSSVVVLLWPCVRGFICGVCAVDLNWFKSCSQLRSRFSTPFEGGSSVAVHLCLWRLFRHYLFRIFLSLEGCGSSAQVLLITVLFPTVFKML